LREISKIAKSCLNLKTSGLILETGNLTTSVYGDSTNFATTPRANHEGCIYDLNGNIRSLARYRKGTGLIDNLTYTYKNSNISNLLDKVEDASGTYGFINGANTTNEYAFDGNGNLTVKTGLIDHVQPVWCFYV
jgi:hypothetical protein